MIVSLPKVTVAYLSQRLTIQPENLIEIRSRLLRYAALSLSVSLSLSIFLTKRERVRERETVK